MDAIKWYRPHRIAYMINNFTETVIIAMKRRINRK